MKKEQGITLISLVITIIVLIILAGVVIMGLTGEEGLLKKSDEAIRISEEEKAKEEIKMLLNEYSIDKYIQEKPLDDFLTSKGVTFTRTGANTIEITQNGYKVTVNTEDLSIIPNDEAVVIAEAPEELFIFDETTGTITGINKNYSKVLSFYEHYGADNCYVSKGGGYHTIYEDLKVKTMLTEDLKVIKIPETINGVNVTKIGNAAFIGCANIIELIIPDTVTSIGEMAFGGCSSLEEIIIPNAVIEINHYTFINCFSLESIVIPNRVTSIGDEAFSNCRSLISITIPNSVTSIGSWTFLDCTSLETITIPNSVTSLENDTFKGCTSLTSITIPNSVIYTGDDLFYGCTNLAKIYCEHSSKPSGWDSDWKYNCSAEVIWLYNEGLFAFDATTGTITGLNPYSDKVISYYDKYNQSEGETVLADDLKTLVIPETINGTTVNQIGQNVFSYCTNLINVVIPNSVVSIGAYAFEYCSGLTNIEISNRVSSIGKGAFYHCTSLTNIIIPNSVTIIKDYLFSGCTSLTNIEIPNSVISIGNVAFYHCTSLTNIIIPNSVISIGDAAFQWCTSLTNIIIPSSVTTIKVNTYYSTSGIFWKCSNLTNIYCEAASKPSGWNSYWKNGCSAAVTWGYVAP